MPAPPMDAQAETARILQLPATTIIIAQRMPVKTGSVFILLSIVTIMMRVRLMLAIRVQDARTLPLFVTTIMIVLPMRVMKARAARLP